MGLNMQDTSSASELKTWAQVLNYLNESCGRKLGKTKLFEDIKKGLLKKKGREGFRQKDVELYAASLPLAGTSDLVAGKARERQVRKEEEEIRRIKAIADKEEFLLAVRKGEYIARQQVYLELAGRAIALSSQLKTNFKARILELVEAAAGKPKKSLELLDLLEAMFDEALHEYAKELDFEVLLEFKENNVEVDLD